MPKLIWSGNVSYSCSGGGSTEDDRARVVLTDHDNLVFEYCVRDSLNGEKWLSYREVLGSNTILGGFEMHPAVKAIIRKIIAP